MAMQACRRHFLTCGSVGVASKSTLPATAKWRIGVTLWIQAVALSVLLLGLAISVGAQPAAQASGAVDCQAVSAFLPLVMPGGAPAAVAAAAQSTAHETTPLATIVTPGSNASIDRLPLYVVIQLAPAARPDTLRAWLNDSEVSTRFYATDAVTLVAELTIEDGLQRGVNSLRVAVCDSSPQASHTIQTFSLSPNVVQHPEQLHLARRTDGRTPTPLLGDAATVPFNPGLYAGSQANTRQNFGYGAYVVRGWAADAPVISSWFLDAIEPDATNFPQLAPLWRWSEVDWEFVPYSLSPQREQIVGQGSFPAAVTTMYRSDYQADGCPPMTGEYNDDELARAVAFFWNQGGQTRTPNEPTTVTPNQTITVTTFGDLAQLAQVPATPSPFGFTPNPNFVPGQTPRYWWTQAYPSFVSTWPLPCNLSLPGDQLRNSVALNLFRMPPGSLVTTGSGITSTVIPDLDQNGLPNAQPKPGTLTNETFVWANDAQGVPSYTPYSGWYTYTLLVTPDFVAYYINAGDTGLGIDGVTPLRRLSISDPTNPYPSVAAFGPNMTGAELTFQDYANTPQPMGNLRVMLQNWVDGNGWSGPQPSDDFGSADAYVQRVSFYPLQSGKPGTTGADYAPATFDVDMSSWTSANAAYQQMKNFHTIYTGNPAFAATQGVSPGLARWTTAPDGSPALGLGLVPIADVPAADFYVLAPGGTSGQAATYVAAEIDVPDQSYATAAFPLTDAFWGSTGVAIPISVWFVDQPAQRCTAHIVLNSDGTWTAGESDPACQSVLPAPGTRSPNNTIGLGAPDFEAMD